MNIYLPKGVLKVQSLALSRSSLLVYLAFLGPLTKCSFKSLLASASNRRMEMKFPSLHVGSRLKSILSCWCPCKEILCRAHVITALIMSGRILELNLKFLALASCIRLSILRSGLL